MSFTYSPLTEEQAEKARQFPLLEHGLYPFKVVSATSKMSQSGNPMTELKLSIWDSQGEEHIVYDYLVGTEKMGWKLRHFCTSVGLLREYEEGKFNEYLADQRCGFAEISFQSGKAKPDGGFYKDKNVVDDYVIPMAGENNADLKIYLPKEMGDKDLQDDEIPF